MSLELPMDYDIFVQKIEQYYPDFIVRVICQDGEFKVVDQMINSNRIDIVVEKGKVTEMNFSEDLDGPVELDEVDIEAYNTRFESD